jgi:hypothetical protein
MYFTRADVQAQAFKNFFFFNAGLEVFNLDHFFNLFVWWQTVSVQINFFAVKRASRFERLLQA